MILTGKGRNFKLLKLESIHSHSYRFHVKRDGGRNMSIATYGQVEEDDLGVKVVGIIQVNLITQLVLLLSMIVLIVVLGICMLTENWDNLPMLILLMTVFILLIIYDQNKMYNQIYAILGKAKKKNAEA